MFKLSKLKQGSSIIEYMVLVLMIATILVAFQKYIVRGFSGRWKAMGDAYGHGRQYDPKPYAQGGTLECFYYRNPVNGQEEYWVATRCYEDCLRGRNGFGNPSDMEDCRGNCHDGHVQYHDCQDSDYSP